MDDHRSARTWAGDRSIRPADMQTFGRQVGDGKEMGIHSYPVQLRYHISPSISFAFVLPLAPCASRFKFITHRNSSIWRTPVNFSQFQWHWLILRNDFQQVEAELFNYPTGISTAWGFRWKQTLFSFHSADPNWCCDGKPRPNLASNKPRWQTTTKMSLGSLIAKQIKVAEWMWQGKWEGVGFWISDLANSRPWLTLINICTITRRKFFFARLTERQIRNFKVIKNSLCCHLALGPLQLSLSLSLLFFLWRPLSPDFWDGNYIFMAMLWLLQIAKAKRLRTHCHLARHSIAVKRPSSNTLSKNILKHAINIDTL